MARLGLPRVCSHVEMQAKEWAGNGQGIGKEVLWR
jgi:hypothetical protein